MEPKLTVYVNANAGFVDNVAKDAILMSALGVGAKTEKDGYYIKAEGGYGKITYAKAEVGKDIPLGDSKLELDTSLGVRYIVTHKERNYYRNILGGNSPTWKSNDTRGYGQLALTYKTPSFKAGLGVQAGIKTSTQPSLDGITLADIDETTGTEYAGRTSKKYVTPTFELEAGKKLRFNLKATFDELKIGGILYF